MKNTRFTIPKKTHLPEGEDYHALRKEGIALLEQMASHTWTDYNEHDPGITILEQLCYALTEIAYRTQFPITDLLSNTEGKIDTDENAFFSAGRMLTSGPIIPDDYRKLIIDRFPEINNAWINASKDGKYEVYIDSANTKLQTDTIDRWLNSQRNLCESFLPSRILSPLQVVVKAEIYIKPTTAVEELLAQLVLNLKDFINKPVRFYTLSEMKEKGYSTDEIFEGPRLHHGFIQHEDLRPRIRELYATSLIKELMSIRGVEGIKRIEFPTQFSNNTDPQYLPIGDFQVAVLDVEQTLSQLTLYSGDAKIYCDIEKALSEYHRLKSVKTRNFRPIPNEAERDYLPPSGNYRNLQAYSSIQHQFPLTYGIGEEGLPPSSSAQRKGQAKQLKGYLLFFEQLMADRFAQLAHIKELFSITQATPTYFFQPLNDVPGIRPLIKPYHASEELPEELPSKKEELPASYTKALQQFITGDEIYTDRRIAFLDHLLARFSIEMWSYHNPFTSSDPKQTEVERKMKLLQNLPELTAYRFQAPKYKDRRCKPSKIQQILALLSDTKDTYYKSFDSILNRMIRVSKIKLENPETEQIIVKGGPQMLPLYLRYGSNISNYLINTEKEKAYLTVQLKVGSENEKENFIDLFQVPETETQTANKLIGKLATRFAYLSRKSERYYLVEHFLLKNENNPSSYLPDDFYNFRFSLIIPAVSARFTDESFHHYLHALFYQLVPAHLSATVLWLDLDEIRFFESLYFEWISLFNEHDKEAQEKKAALGEKIASFLSVQQTKKK